MILGRPLIRLDQTGSTMDLASQLANHGAKVGTTVLAGHQTAGRGRAGRTWATAPDTSILMSFIAHTRRRHHELGALSLLLGLAVSKTVDRYTGMASAIKWPNDVLVGGRKIAGILPVSRALPDRDDLCLIIGIGLNVNAGASQLPETGTSMAMISATSHSFDDVLAALLDNLAMVMDRFDTGDAGELWHEANLRLAFRGERVRIEDAGRIIDGVLRGITPAGLLELELESGRILTVASGDLTRGPVTITEP